MGLDQWYEQAMTPVAERWMDSIVDNLYGYLGDLKDQAVKRKKMDWKRKNEIDFDNSALNLSNAKRRKIIKD